MKILVISGIRSDYDILYPVLKELQENNHQVMIAVSGAHLSDQFSNTYTKIIGDGFEIVDKIDSLLSTDRVIQRAKGTGILIQGLAQTIERTNPDILLVLGDREEAISTAITGNYMNKLVVHIGGGDTVFGNADDPIRFATSKLAHLHCCSAKFYADNLKKIGEEDFRIFFTGNPAYVNIDTTPKISKKELFNLLDLKCDNYIVLIKHPLSSELHKAETQMLKTINALKSFCEINGFQTICIPPNSDPGSFEMKKVVEKMKNEDWLISADTLPRFEFINLIRNARVLVGNSSMGILEAPHYKLPVVNIGNRQKGRLNAGNVEFVTYDKNEISESINKACFDEDYRLKIKKIINPFGDGTAAKKVREAIESIDLNDRKWYVKQKLC